MIDERKLIEDIDEELKYSNDEFHDEEIMFRKGLRFVKKIIKRQPKVGEWKHISEELPNENEKVLWQGAKGGMFIGYIVSSNISNGYIWVNVPNSRQRRHGIAWCRLPAPYKGDKHEGI